MKYIYKHKDKVQEIYNGLDRAFYIALSSLVFLQITTVIIIILKN